MAKVEYEYEEVKTPQVKKAQVRDRTDRAPDICILKNCKDHAQLGIHHNTHVWSFSREDWFATCEAVNTVMGWGDTPSNTPKEPCRPLQENDYVLQVSSIHGKRGQFGQIISIYHDRNACQVRYVDNTPSKWLDTGDVVLVTKEEYDNAVAAHKKATEPPDDYSQDDLWPIGTDVVIIGPALTVCGEAIEHSRCKIGTVGTIDRVDPSTKKSNPIGPYRVRLNGLSPSELWYEPTALVRVPDGVDFAWLVDMLIKVKKS